VTGTIPWLERRGPIYRVQGLRRRGITNGRLEFEYAVVGMIMSPSTWVKAKFPRTLEIRRASP